MFSNTTKVVEEILKESAERLAPIEVKFTLDRASLKKMQDLIRQIPGFGGFGNENPEMFVEVLINPKITDQRKFRDNLSRENLGTSSLEVMRN